MAQPHDPTKNCTTAPPPPPPHVSLELRGHAGPTRKAAADACAAGAARSGAWAAVAACLAALGLAGAGLLVWWGMAFHPSDEQLWMVPVGLVLLGTPLVACLSIFASGACRRLDRLSAVLSEPEPPPAPPAAAAAVIPD